MALQRRLDELQIFIENENPILLHDEDEARLCAEYVGWKEECCPFCLPALSIYFWISAPSVSRTSISRRLKVWFFEGEFTYQPLKARFSPEKMPILPSPLHSVTKRWFLVENSWKAGLWDFSILRNYTPHWNTSAMKGHEHLKYSIISFRWSPLWHVCNITRFCQPRLNSGHLLKPSGEGEVKAGLGERLKGGSLPARLLSEWDLLGEQVHGQDGHVEGVSRQLPFRSSWRGPLLTRRGCLQCRLLS